MKWLMYALLAVLLLYLVTAIVVAAFIMLFGGSFWAAVKSGFITPFMWAGLFK